MRKVESAGNSVFMQAGKVLFTGVILIAGLAACSKPGVNFTVPNTNIQITFPSDWVQMPQKNLNKAMDKLKTRQDTPAEYKHAMDVLKQFNRYVFTNLHGDGKKHRNSSLMILTRKADNIDLDEVVKHQTDGMHNMTGIVSITLNDCPKMKLPNYRCYSATAKIYDKKQTEYHYLTQNNGYFIEMGFGISSPDELQQFSGIISSVRMQNKPQAKP